MSDSVYRNPTQKGVEIFPGLRIPARVVIEGYDTSEISAQVAYQAVAADVDGFYLRSANAADQSGLDVYSAVSKTSRGEFRFWRNHGQDFVYVRVFPQVAKEVKEDEEKREREKKLEIPIDPVLAIDVLFDNSLFLVADITWSLEADYRRYKKWYFDVLDVVGMRVELDDEDNAYKAISTEPADDNRLKPMIKQDTFTTTIERTLLVDKEGAQKWFAGQGFIARPKAPVRPEDSPEPTTIRVYAASINISKSNEYPDKGYQDFQLDGHPSYVYDFEKSIKWQIRTRQYVDVKLSAVRCTTKTEENNQDFTSPPHSGDAPPTVAGPITTSESLIHELKWAFAVLPGWEDPGEDTEPTDPDSTTEEDEPAMGTPMETKSGTTTVVGLNPLGQRILQEPEWNDEVDDMTLIATIKWTPPTNKTETGKVEITTP